MAVSKIRFDNLPGSIQILIFAAIVGCLAFAFYTCHLRDLLRERNSIQAEINKLELSVAEEKANEDRITHLRKELAHVGEQLETLLRNLPDQKELPAILKSVQQMAKASNLRINKLMPKAIVPREFYSDWPVQIEVAGNYDGLGLFFEKVSRAARIIDVSTISIKGSETHINPTQTLTASCTATTFVFKEESQNVLDENQIQKDSTAKKQRKNQW